jgi:septal ring factor EnvC (AmiA/AmiB activator)
MRSVLLLLFACASPGAARAQGGGAAPDLLGARVLHEEEAAAQREAARLRAEAEELSGRLISARAAEQDLLGELSLLDRELAVAARRNRAAGLESKAAGLAAARAQAAAAALDERLAGTRRRIGLVLQALDRQGERPEWRRLVEGGDEAAEDFAVGAALRHAKLGRELEAAILAAREAEAEAARRLSALEQARATEQASLAELSRRRSAREDRLEILRRASDRFGAELAQARTALQDLLGGAEASPAPVRHGPAVAPPSVLPSLAERRGRLRWPLDDADRGRLLERFGRVVDRRHGTRTLRHGLVVEAPAGAPIRAVAAGRVVFRDWYKGFGLALVIDHGHGFLSVAAHCREVFLLVGEPVEEGQVVGAVGESGSLDGPRLYFQLQSAGEPVNPEDWLTR